MAAPRDQAARVVRPEPDMAEGEPARDAANLAEQLRTHVAEETRRAPQAPGQTPAQTPAGAPAATADAAAPKSGARKKFVMIGVVGLLALAAASYGVYYVFAGRFYVSTDDAYVRANNTMLGARVAGHVTAILPGDNTVVRKGDTVFRIDDGDYRIAVDAARTKIATQQATIDRIGRQVTALESAVAQAKAQLASTEAALKRAGLDFEVTRAQQAEARAQLAELQTSLAKAERDLDFTYVRAPVDGTFSNRLVNTGDFVQAGQRLGNLVPLNDVFIDANYKETQLKRIRPGQPVTIKVDAYGFRKFKGVVDSISPAAGSVFTLLPPDNATGNFTKIVQRLPVRIRVPKDVAKQNLLRAGMSVYATVDTREGAHDADSESDLDSAEMTKPR